MRALFWTFIFGAALALTGLLGGCANILPPSGGPKDTTVPRLLSVLPADSALGARPRKITLRFDEYVVLEEAATQITLSPLLAIAPTATANLRTVEITLPDTLLQPGTTYRLSLGTAIRDLHEGNPFPPFTYTFSTGNYFDSLQLRGQVLDAATGRPDTGVRVLLYDGNTAAGDTAVISRKPLYAATTNAQGYFGFGGLPLRVFQIYALGEENGNLIFDGAGERIAFSDSGVTPAATAGAAVVLRSFLEPDTNTTAAKTTGTANSNRGAAAPDYLVETDTADIRRRTASLTGPLRVQTTNFRIAAILPDRIFLSQDSGGTAVEVPVEAQIKTADSSLLLLTAPWKPDVVYTLRLLKGFVKDTAGRDLLPGRWTFRTKRDEDYATLQVNLPGKFRGRNFLLQVVRDGRDTVWNAPVSDTTVRLRRLEPGAYSMLVIADANENGKWDPGSLGLRRQPEIVFPFPRITTLKAGWDNVVDWPAE